MSALADFIVARRERQAPYAASEQATKQGLILPLLAQVGWSSWDVEQVVPEYPVGGGRVDYCLKLADRPLVFLEAKKSTETLERHDGQLLEYAFKAGVKLAALTNGLRWRLYLPMAEGSWDQRLFFTIDLVVQPAEEVASHFVQLLGKDAVASGTALAAAEAYRSEGVRKRTVEDFLPKAWQILLTAADEMIVEIVTEKVAQLSGVLPTAQEVAEFLGKAGGGRDVPRVKGSEPAQPAGSITAPDVIPVPNPSAGFIFMRPKAYELFGVATTVETFKDVLLGVAADLAGRHPERVNEFLKMRGRKRAYFSEDQNELTEPRRVAGTLLWAETNLSANDIVRRCREMLAICGHPPEALHVIAAQR